MNPSSHPAPSLVLFGAPTYEGALGRVAFPTGRPFQLLVYLATRRRWVRREELADVLYPERDAAQARSNLRKVLLLAGRVAGVEIERQGDLLRWAPATDLQAFEAAIDGRRSSEAIALGSPIFLDGFECAFLGDGAAWLRAERQRLTTLWQSACAMRLAELGERPVDAVQLARAMLDRDPLDEAGAIALARSHLALGDSEAARMAIAAYSRRLTDDLGLEPTAAVRELAEAARTRFVTPTLTSAQAADAFVGRHAELGRMVRLLRDPACRLLTVTGPGGVGKTSLVGRLAARLVPEVVDAVTFVPLADLTDVEQVPSRIASRIEATLSGDSDAWLQVGAAIGERALGLVLDNAEPFLLGPHLGPLLRAAPRLKLVLTSRARFGIAEETAFALEGLPLPDDDGVDVEVLRRCDSVALLEARALAASRTFDLAAQASGAVRLVRAVDGLPLAIELAAVWTRLLPLADIADEVGRSVDLLDGDAISGRGLRATFAQSWRLLSDRERSSVPRLALLPGDFDRDMAAEVAGAALPVLAALADKSLLRPDGAGRFSMHPLLRACARERATPDDDLMPKLAGFVARWMGDWDGTAAAMQLLVDRIRRELPHVRAAWSWAVERGAAPLIAAMGRPLSNFYEQQGLWGEGEGALQAAAQALRRAEVPGEHALGIVLRGLSALQFRMDAPEAIEASANEMMRLARTLGDIRLMRYAINMSGLSLRGRGRFEEARRRFEDGHRRAVAEGSAPHTALFTANIARTDALLGRYDDALAGHERALSLYRTLVDDYTAAIELIGIAVVLRVLGRPADAVERLREALAACVQNDFQSVRCTVMLNLGQSFEELGDAPASAKWLASALGESRQCAEPQIEVQALLASARLDCAQGRADVARSKGWEALTLAERTPAMAPRVLCVAAFGDILVHEGRAGDGIALVRWAMAQSSLDRLTRDLLARRLALLLERHGGADVAVRDCRADLPLASALALAAVPAD